MSADAGTAAEAGRLVDPQGLAPRVTAAGAGSNARTLVLRGAGLAYRVAAGNFPILLLLAVAGAILGVYVSGGAVLMGTQIKNALVLGAIYALVAIGYTMVYGIIELINFAHGDVFTLSGFYAFLIAGWFGLDTLATGSFGGLVLALIILFPLTMVAAGFTGVAIERVAYRRLRDAPRLAPLITAIGVSFFLEGFMLPKFGSGNQPTGKQAWINCPAFNVGGRSAPPEAGTHCTSSFIGGITIDWRDLFVVITALALMFLLGAFVRRTRLGKAMRATAQDRDAALLCGINVNRTIQATFFIGSALAAAGAIVYSIEYNLIQWSLGFRLGIIAFTAAVLGGIGNIVGAGLGGFLIGVIYVFGGQLAGGEWSESLIFALLVIILTFRPVGLFGVDVGGRA